MSAPQYALVWRPDPTHVTRAIGPFRSLEKAEAVMAEFEVLEESLDIVTGFDDMNMGLLPQIVALESWADTKRELIEKYGDPA